MPRDAWTAAKITGYVLAGMWALTGISLVWFLIVSFDAEFASKYGPKLFSGLALTIELVVISIVIGAALSLPVAIGRMSTNRIARGFTFAYVYVFRGTPLIVQAYLVYYGAGSFREELQTVGLWWFFREAYYCVVLTFSLNTSAYQAEILRGAIQSVAKGQWEAAHSLGLPRWVVLWRIVLPQAFIVALRPYGNEIILMIKGSAIASIVTLLDLMGETKRVFSRTFDYQVYLWAAILYLIMVETLRRIWDALERRLTRHLKYDND